MTPQPLLSDNNLLFTSLLLLFESMKLAAKDHPNWVFMAMDEPGTGSPRGPRLGWIAFPPGHEGFERAWTIRLSDARMQAQKLNGHWQDALRTQASRNTTLLKLVIGRQGDTRPPPPPTPSRYDILMQD